MLLTWSAEAVVLVGLVGRSSVCRRRRGASMISRHARDQRGALVFQILNLFGG